MLVPAAFPPVFSKIVPLRKQPMSQRTIPAFRGSGRPGLSIKTTKGSDVSDTFISGVKEGIQSITPEVSQALNSAGWKIQVGKFLNEIAPYWKNTTPRGGDSWETADHRSAVTWDSKIYMSEYQWVPRPTGPSKFANSRLFSIIAPVEPPIYSNKGKLFVKSLPAYTVRHEAGHAFDILLHRLSNTKEFIEAYQRDLELMTPTQKQEVYYFIQPDAQGNPTKGGLREALADAFATLWGGGCNEVAHFLQRFPNVCQYAAMQLEAFKRRNALPPSAWDKGPPKKY